MTFDSKRPSIPGSVIARFDVLLILASLGLGYFGYNLLVNADIHYRTSDRWRLYFILADSGFLLLGSIIGLLHLKLRGPDSRLFTVLLLGLATVISYILAAFGTALLIDAKARGGDWVAFAMGAIFLLYIFLPLSLGWFTAFVVTCHWKYRAATKPPQTTH